MMRDRIESEKICERFGVAQGAYGLVTLHRPSNVDSEQSIGIICDALIEISKQLPIVFAVHPRTKKNLSRNGLLSKMTDEPNLKLVDPLSYIPFMNLVFYCKMVITDSGGLQEETTYLGIPCFTLRDNTERPVTITQGTNHLCKSGNLLGKINTYFHSGGHVASIPDMWDGNTAHRVSESIRNILVEKLRG